MKLSDCRLDTRGQKLHGVIVLILMLCSGLALAHGVADLDKRYISEISGTHLIAFMYLGAKHMMTGYDHLLFLFGVVFFLYRFKDIALYVTLFAVGHMLTLLAGVYFGWRVNPFVVDAVIGLSVVYKALDNLGAFEQWFGIRPNVRATTFAFGLVHGMGLATKFQDYEIASDGLLANLLAFSVGVEVGQILALVLIVIAMNFWRLTSTYWRGAYLANVLLMTAGFVLFGFHCASFIHGHH